MTDCDRTLPGNAEAALVACLLVSVGSSVGGRLTLLVGVPLTLAGLIAAWIAAHRTRFIATPIAMPHPAIDVWALTQTSVQALLHGIHPYTVTAPDVYRGVYDYGYTTSAYPYMPLDLLVNVPAVALFGDYRFGLALCFPITIALLRAAGRRLAVHAHTIDVLTLVLALQPHAAFIVAAGWIEPMMAATLATFVYLSAREMGGTGAAIAFLLLPALKQYVAAPVLMFLAMRPRPRAVAAGVLVAAATVVPFLVWNPQPTIAGMTAILTNMRAPAAFRTDSDSLTAVAALLFGWRPGPWLRSHSCAQGASRSRCCGVRASAACCWHRGWHC